MTNRPKELGTQWESECVRYLQDNGISAERRALAGAADKGDISFPPDIGECKNTQRIDLAGGIDELVKEIQNAGARYGFLLIKRRRKSVADAYAVMTFQQLVSLLKEVSQGDTHPGTLWTRGQ